MSKIRTTLGIALFALAASALPASADLYFGFGAGNTNIDDRVAGSSDELNANANSEHFFFGLELGRHAALEFGRNEFGPLEDTITFAGVPTLTKYDADGHSITLLFREEITDNLSLYLRAGVVNWDTITDTGAFITHNSGQNGAYGFGATYRAGDHLTFRAEYSQYNLGEVDLIVPSFSVAWGF